MAQQMGIALAEYQDMLTKVRGTQLVYLEDMSGHTRATTTSSTAMSSTTPTTRSALLQDHRMRSALVEAIKACPSARPT
jgi:RNA polymerase sigma factor for flagellar operon FliA